MNKECPLSISKQDHSLKESKKPLIIGGPCSAESKMQLLTTARELKQTGKIDLFRAGIWKPRTRPNSFEGVGEEGLASVKSETRLPVITEVANANHVELCLKYEIDALWIGARTTVNPFSVQEIADALKGIDIPVYVKNPLNPDLSLWLGALERINQAGITRLGAIHRGFSSFKNTPFRNNPMWEFPIELKTICPDLSIVCDPSHIAGDRELIAMVAQKALDLDMDGLMIESHMTPDLALSDAKQQITPDQFGMIITDLVIRNSTGGSSDFSTQLDQLRSDIDKIDDDIIQTLAARMNIAEKIGAYKKENNITILQVARWDDIFTKAIQSGNTLGLPEKFVRNLFNLIHKESINRQTHVMNLNKPENSGS